MAYTQQHTFTNESLTAALLNNEFSAIETAWSGLVETTGAQTIAGVKTFTSIPVLPATDPTSATQAASKGYVDGGLPTGGDAITVTGSIAGDNIVVAVTDGGIKHAKFEDGAVALHGFTDTEYSKGGAGLTEKTSFGIYVPANAGTLNFAARLKNGSNNNGDEPNADFTIDGNNSTDLYVASSGSSAYKWYGGGGSYPAATYDCSGISEGVYLVGIRMECDGDTAYMKGFVFWWT